MAALPGWAGNLLAVVEGPLRRGVQREPSRRVPKRTNAATRRDGKNACQTATLARRTAKIIPAGWTARPFQLWVKRHPAAAGNPSSLSQTTGRNADPSHGHGNPPRPHDCRGNIGTHFSQAPDEDHKPKHLLLGFPGADGSCYQITHCLDRFAHNPTCNRSSGRALKALPKTLVFPKCYNVRLYNSMCRRTIGLSEQGGRNPIQRSIAAFAGAGL